MDDEKEFILLLIEADAAAWRLFNVLYFEIIYAQALRIAKDEDDASDIRSLVLNKVRINIKEFKGECKLSTWINKIIHSESLNFIKQKTNRLKGVVPDLINDDDASDANRISDNLTPLSILEYKECERMHLLAIGKLKGNQKKAFDFMFFDDLSSIIIGERMDKSVAAIDLLIFRARVNIRLHLSIIKKEKKKKP